MALHSEPSLLKYSLDFYVTHILMSSSGSLTPNHTRAPHLTADYVSPTGRLLPNVCKYTSPLDTDVVIREYPPSKYLEYFTAGRERGSTPVHYYSSSRPIAPRTNLFRAPSFVHTEKPEGETEDKIYSTIYMLRRGKILRNIPLWPYEFDGHSQACDTRYPKNSGSTTPLKEGDDDIYASMIRKGGILSKESTAQFREALINMAHKQAEGFNKKLEDHRNDRS
eukprot:GHVH01006659.1.p1 GENE.GHVH01006659.1~~GHVH01006659.1.p1  ORF type:complete len:223 (+),score=10.21 GHVH01006659.1:325-993(+)